MASSTHSIPTLAVKIEPVGDRVVVMPIEKETTTKSGIVIPETASGEKPQDGVVLALGNGKLKYDGKELSNPRDFLKVGDRVLYGKYSGDEVKLKMKDGKEMEVKVLRLDAILGKIAA